MSQETHTPEPVLYDEADDTSETHIEVDSHGVATADEGLAASLGLNVQLFAFQLLNFAIVAAIVWFMILKPLTSKLEERKNLIDESLDKAKEVETNLARSEKTYEEKLDEAKVEANKVIEKAHAESKTLGENMKMEAKNEVEKLVEHTKKSIAAEKVSMLESVRAEASDLIVAALEKILNEKVDDKSDKKIIEDALAKLDK
ncbi:F0F1 ATP synthase subunit B [Candidatus Parcubacteria bacterium]|jgi:F-type H+-transporting ATPase subunit b|nr:F0F1 ATP synthase subunit B [Candidatus Parcubacteria bacterium]MBT3948841.1 F0F1 ATP synthase subunit B [Candidatus Parcubacteria bacterium]